MLLRQVGLLADFIIIYRKLSDEVTRTGTRDLTGTDLKETQFNVQLEYRVICTPIGRKTNILKFTFHASAF